ncbi:MAG: methionyl-tRNA formyltransferase [Marinoscillum sp.]|nr:methionyl-tRNA formyltransferase [Marinoscillum sp.]OUX26866.1 MAG: methionyl-tRNA formyltransferase [Flammeovirgaceae bacterium TMED262]|tara:strand:- start:17582 stop:18496 length:915 start_codon:yes stop_codon:yes gene_type:complete
MISKSIIFMGTPDFAVKSLEKIIQQNINVIAVITAPDKQSGRGRKINFSPIKKYALDQSIDVYQPKNLKDEKFQNEIQNLKADLFVVVAFRMLPESLINIPKLGCINLHASYLPHYRGAAPINWVIINGEKETGVTIFFLNKRIDEGDVIMQKKIKINKNETAGTLHDRLMNLGSNLLTKSIFKIFDNNFKKVNQEISPEHIKAPKIDKNICILLTKHRAKKNINIIHGLSPYPGAIINHKNKSYKIFSARSSKYVTNKKVGLFINDNKIFFNNEMKESIEILEIQAEGKKRMNAYEYVKGNKL